MIVPFICLVNKGETPVPYYDQRSYNHTQTKEEKTQQNKKQNKINKSTLTMIIPNLLMLNKKGEPPVPYLQQRS